MWANKLSIILKNSKTYHRELNVVSPSPRSKKDPMQFQRVQKYKLLKRNNDKIAINLESIIAQSLRARFYSQDQDQQETFSHNIFDNLQQIFTNLTGTKEAKYTLSESVDKLGRSLREDFDEEIDTKPYNL